jgi:hypothetical protein
MTRVPGALPPFGLSDGSLFAKNALDEWIVYPAVAPETATIVALVLKAATEGAAVVHSSAIQHCGKAVMMVGPSDAGKSTFAGLMSDCPLLSDEFNIIKLGREGMFTVSSTPLRSSCPREPNDVTAPLGALLFPQKDTKDFLEPVSPDAALRLLAQQAVAPQVKGYKVPFHLLAEVARRVPAFNFHFRKDPACRRLLDELPLAP